MLFVCMCVDATTRAIETSHAKPAAPDVLAPAEPRNGAIERYYYLLYLLRNCLVGKRSFYGIMILLPLAIKGYDADDDFILGRVYFFACSSFQRKPASQSCC